MKILGRVEPRNTGVDALTADHHWVSHMPEDTEWYRGAAVVDEIGGFSHIFSPLWAAISGGTGLISATAQGIDLGNLPIEPEFAVHATAINTIADALDTAQLGSLLLGTNDLAGNAFVVLDGNHRAVALEILRSRGETVLAQDLDVFVALSRSVPLHGW